MSYLILNAYKFAKDAHSGQIRRHTNEDYFCHVVRVAKLVSTVTSNDKVIAAALLHDTIEDCGVSSTRILSLFGREVQYMVDRLTNDFTDGNRNTRYSNYLKQLQYSSSDVQSIKIADLIDNTPSIQQFEEKFWNTAYRQECLNYIRTLTLADKRLISKLEELVL